MSAAAPPAQRPHSPTAIAVRFAASGLLIVAYFALSGYITGGIASALRMVAGWTLAEWTPKVIAVTLEGVALVAIWWAVIKRDIRFQAPILITFILAIGDATFGILESHTSEWLTWLTGGRVTSYSPTFVAIIVTIALDMVLGRFMRGKWQHLASAYITGISVGIVVKSPSVWPFVVCALLSIESKYVLRVRDRHLWNPSNFGVTVLLLFASLAQQVKDGLVSISHYWDATIVWLGDVTKFTDTATLSVQAGNEIYPVLLIWLLGSLILYRLKRLHIPLTFVPMFVLLAFLRSAVTHRGWLVEVAPITSPLFQLYIFFMITDPPTTTKRKWSRCLVAVLVAVMDTVLRLAFQFEHALLYALFIVGPTSNLTEILLTRGTKKPQGPASGVASAPRGLPDTGR